MASNSKFPKVVFIYDRYSKASTSKAASIEIRITYKRKQKYISTGIAVLANQWDGCVVNHPNAVQLNGILNEKLSKINKTILSLMEREDFDLPSLSKELTKEGSREVVFEEYCSKRITIKTYGKAEGTIERYHIFFNYLVEFGKMKEFSDIKEQSIIAYDRFLQAKGMKPSSRWGNHHRYLNSIINDAIEEELLHRNPYKHINIEKVDVDNKTRYLTQEEFNKIIKVSLKANYLRRMRDLFIFQTYTCLSYVDLKEFDSSRIVDVKGTKVYIGYRHKTKKQFTIPLLPQALHILEIYNGELPVVSAPKYNLWLKRIAKEAGVNKPISSHWARHTGATMLLNEGVDMKIISRICGHSSTRITEQIYAKLLDETVVDAIQEIKNRSK